MVPTPEEFSYEYWLTGPYNHNRITCLMPYGVCILLENIHHNATLAEIKEDLWDAAVHHPLPGKLHNMSEYFFKCVNSMAELEELHDETRHLSDVRPTGGILLIAERVQDRADNHLNVQIGHLIGKRLQEFDELDSAEVNDFRFKMRKIGDDIAQNRTKMTWLEKLYYQFPPRISPLCKALQDTLNQLLQNGNINIASKFEHRDNSFTFNVPYTIKPEKLLEHILNKKATLLNIRGEKVCDYVLKVCGQDEYLVGDYKIIQFQYIQDCIAREVVPTLVTVSRESVPIEEDNVYESLDNFDSRKAKTSYSTMTLRKKGKHKSSWNITDNFTITLGTVNRLNCDIKRNPEIGIQAGLFHGGKILCQPQKISEKLISEKPECGIDERLVFDIQVCNIPRCAKLCFVVYEVTKNSKGGKVRKIKESDLFYNPLAWVNTSVYDFKNQLKSGAVTLYMWTYAEDMLNEEMLHPLGTVVSNPNKKNSTSITLIFDSYVQDQIVMYPLTETMIAYAIDRNNYRLPASTEESEPDITHCQRLLSDVDSLYEVHDQDRKNIWSLRWHWCQKDSGILPKLLCCIDWDNKDHVSEVTALLREWKKLPVEKALELLDYAYADQEVRRFAVQCLSDVSDETLLLYLLQLVQAIKHELYLDCDLVKFLLQRALNNQKIGHYLFWHLRSEMQVASVSVRFGLILEAYCRGSQDHIPILAKQLECLEKLKKCSELVRPRKDKEKARALLQEQLSSESMDCNVRSPLDPSYRCTRIRMEKCRVMDSKMRPLWIVFQNSDIHGGDIYIIFKNGDDLRQDMLTLQMLRIMDRLWKQEGLDLRMNPYNCISMEYRVGMIEVVLNAETIANIQKEKGMFSATSAFRKGSLLAWLKDHNATEAELKKAINEFTLSCAGYCVATYVLGIADRHSDNIMVKKTGQLFHIDFGHILGHFKEKFGFKRERVPFVLTHDFVHVISKGQKNALEFKIFQEYCEKAFMILRKHGNLILSLCAMMISTGLPELTSERDLNYLRETLVLSKSEEDALNHFRSKFDEALSNSWKTSMNWATHNLSKNNKN